MIKKLLVVLTMTVLLAGCEGDGYNQTKLRQVIVDEMKTTEIVQSPNSEYKYIVRAPDGSVWLVECMGRDAQITAKALLFPAKIIVDVNTPIN